MSVSALASAGFRVMFADPAAAKLLDSTCPLRPSLSNRLYSGTVRRRRPHDAATAHPQAEPAVRVLVAACAPLQRATVAAPPARSPQVFRHPMERVISKYFFVQVLHRSA